MGEWYWCLKHGAVEPAEGCSNADRLGPYDTREEAGRALQTAAERTAAWDAEDRRWRDG